MQPAISRALEFDRVREALAREASTPLGRARALALTPWTDPAGVAAALETTREAKDFVERGGSLAIEAADDFPVVLEHLSIEGEPLDPLALLALARFVESVDRVTDAIESAARAAEHGRTYLHVAAIAARAGSFANEAAAIRRAIQPAGEIKDDASPALRDIRDRLRRHRAKLRSTLEGLTRGRDTAKYLQDQI